MQLKAVISAKFPIAHCECDHRRARYACRWRCGALASTANTKLSETLSFPSLTVNVIIAVPVIPSAGVTVAVRVVPPPPKMILASGTSAGL